MTEYAFKRGRFVANHIHVEDGELSQEQIEPNGVEITIDDMKKLTGHFHLKNGQYNTPNVRVVQEEKLKFGSRYWEIGPGAYEAVTEEIIEIPEGHVGIAFPRSRLPRSGVWVTQPLWDTGFRGRGSVTLFTLNGGKIDTDFRPFQLCLIEAEDPEELYSGVHGQEPLNELKDTGN